MKNYGFNEFLKQFPDNDTCLEYIRNYRFPGLSAIRTKGRKSYITRSGRQIHPLKGTIFQGTKVPLQKWFYAIFLFANSRNGVSAKELQRQLSVTYKTAWRMCVQIRSLMKQDPHISIKGIVEADETYIGGNRRLNSWRKPKIAVVGLLERNGRVVARALSKRSEFEIAPFVKKHLRQGSTLYTDSAPVYDTLRGYKRGRVVHTAKEYVRGNTHTNTIEAFWSHVKRNIRGTHHSVSRKHIQSYVDAAVFRWNCRENVFSKLLERI